MTTHATPGATPPAPDRVARFESDIAGSPTALARLLDRWRPPDLGGRSRFAISGLGSSRYAAMPVVARFRATGGTAWVEQASAAAGTAPAEDLVFVAVSASGRTPEVVAAARAHRGRSLVVAVTDRAASPLADAADLVASLEAGEETAGIACRTFRATVAALALLSGAVDVAGLRPAVAGLEMVLAGRAAWTSTIADALDGSPSIDVLAEARLVGLAEQAALMLREAPRLPAHAAETGDWLHTHVYLALPGHRVLLFPGSAADAEVIDTVRRRGGEIVTVPSVVDAAGRRTTDAIERALTESVVAELLAAELWRRVSAG